MNFEETRELKDKTTPGRYTKSYNLSLIDRLLDLIIFQETFITDIKSLTKGLVEGLFTVWAPGLVQLSH